MINNNKAKLKKICLLLNKKQKIMSYFVCKLMRSKLNNKLQKILIKMRNWLEIFKNLQMN